MKKRYLGLLAMSTVLTLGLVAVNEHNERVDAESEYYVKVTENLSDWTGNYLIVYEAGNIAFDGSLTILDAVGNTKAVTISNSKIEATDAMKAISFNITEGYTVESASGYRIGRESDGNGLLSSTTKKYVNTLSLNDDDSVNIISAGAYLRYNAASDQTRFRYYKSSSYTGQKAIQLYKLESDLSGGDSGTEQPDPTPVDKTSEVKALFQEYYNDGVYTKASELYVNEIVAEEVAKYFHASADVRYRKTEYTAEGLTMTTSATGAEGSYGNASTYTNGDNCVIHTGVGGNYTVTQYTSVDDWFVTLTDFIGSEEKGWTEENGVYTYDLTSTGLDLDEAEMTRMAREFVAPMWLAPSADNVTYAIFDKLTVKEVNSELVMSLYVEKGNEGITDNEEGLFSQVKLSYVPSTITSIEEALAAEAGAEVELTGTVTAITTPWSDTFNNISFTLTDENENSISVYRCDTKVVRGDIVTVTGTIGVHNSVNQVAEGSTAVINDHDESYDEIPVITSITEALAAADGSDVKLTGTVISIDTAYNSTYDNISVTIADEQGNQIYAYRMTGNVSLYEIIEVTGTMATYNSARQINSGSTFVNKGTHTCSTFTEATCKEAAKCIVCNKEGTGALGHIDSIADEKCDRCGEDLSVSAIVTTLATFDFGSNGSASHVDGNSLGTSTSYTVGSYKLSLTSMSSVYGPAYDAKGNSCIKFGTSSKTGTMTFTVPENVTEVVIYVAKYKSNTTKVSVNGTTHTLTKNSDNGEYDVITVDTSKNKTVKFETVSGGVRCMVNTIVFNGTEA